MIGNFSIIFSIIIACVDMAVKKKDNLKQTDKIIHFYYFKSLTNDF